MNTISINGQTQAMDGRSVYNSLSVQKSPEKVNIPETDTIPNSAAEVSNNLEKTIASAKESAQELQKLSDMVSGHRLQFNVNEDLDRVVVRVVDSSTNEIIREIPSEDLQRIQLRMKQTIGVLFDEII